MGASRAQWSCYAAPGMLPGILARLQVTLPSIESAHNRLSVLSAVANPR